MLFLDRCLLQLMFVQCPRVELDIFHKNDSKDSVLKSILKWTHSHYFSFLQQRLLGVELLILAFDILSVNRHYKFRHQRSEEHTSELQSRGHLVCRLLLEK